jgi:hypothetical protein
VTAGIRPELASLFIRVAIHPEATMKTENSISSVAALVDSNAAAETPSPSTIPPAPESGVILCGTPVRSASSAPSAPPPCAELWPRADAAATLHASQVDYVAAEEVEFFFASDPEDRASIQARAVIASWIAELDPRDKEALALYYEPEPWPESILDEGLDYSSGYALVLSRASASAWRPHRRRRFAAEQMANEQLRAAVLERGPRALRHLTRRAEWDFAAALRAYSKTRGRAPSVLAGLVRASSASEES